MERLVFEIAAKLWEENVQIGFVFNSIKSIQFWNFSMQNKMESIGKAIKLTATRNSLSDGQ